jgi:uncharacterized protein YjiS (DUF1127 family)
MATAYTTANLGFGSTKQEKRVSALQFLIRFEAWLDRRATRKALYQLDDHMLADIGLSRADVERINSTF